jgi:predicted PurR-regulated permease PerM
MAARHKPFSPDHPIVITFLLFAIIGFMYFAADVLKPVALAILLSFALVPVVRIFERGKVPRVPAVVLTVLVVLGSLGFVGYQVGKQLNLLAKDLPKYEDNIRAKIEKMKPGKAGTIEDVSKFAGDVASSLESKPDRSVQEVRVVNEPNFGEQASKLVGPYLEGLGSAFIVLILLLYLMINRENMSDRLIRLFGRGKISLTTRTIEEVGQRISRYLITFAAVNSSVGLVVGLGLWGIGIPYALLWGFLAAALRFIPYAGPATAFALPLLFSVATSEDWNKPLEVAGLFVVLELAANMVLEPVIYGKTTGVSALALLVAAMFWTWLWGGLGLLLSTPLTVCLAVLGKYVPSLSFFATFLREEVDLDPGVRFYQRLLAMDQDGAAAVIEATLKKHPRAEVFDRVLIPTLSMAERDFSRDDIDEREQAFIIRVISDVLEELEGEPEVDLASLSKPGVEEAENGIPADPDPLAPRILALPAHDASDALVLKMLHQLMATSGVPLDAIETVETPLHVVSRVETEMPAMILISHLPPDGLTATRYLVRRIRARYPKLPILVGRWGERGDVEGAADRLTDAGATSVFSTLAETRDRLIEASKPPAEARVVDAKAPVLTAAKA